MNFCGSRIDNSQNGSNKEYSRDGTGDAGFMDMPDGINEELPFC